MRIGIVGGGISGLTLAYELQKRGVSYRLWEASGQPGGYIQSRRETGPNGGHYLRELGPNSLLGDADLLLWLDELGLTPTLNFAKPVSKARFIFRDGTYKQLPSGPLSLVFGDFFSWRTKLAVFRERNNHSLSPEGETLAQFFRRRFSQEIVDYALGPFVGGIYAGDPEKLLVSETFPILLQYEKEHGSVLRGFIKNQSAAGRRQSFSFQDGMQMLPDAIATKLSDLSLNDPVQQIRKTLDGWEITAQNGIESVDTLVLATDTATSARLMESVNPSFAGALRAVTYPPMVAIHTAYKRQDVGHSLNGFGGLNPTAEGRLAAGHIWSSSVFEGRCPADEVLFTTFIGGVGAERNTQLSDDVLKSGVHQELVNGFEIRAHEPVFQTIQRWERAIPQYDVSIVAVKDNVKALENDQLFVCANWYGGVSLYDCIQKAQKLAIHLTNRTAVNNF
ncbi:protoporphyrinogen oxidase [Spirosoma harenae]